MSPSSSKTAVNVGMYCQHLDIDLCQTADGYSVVRVRPPLQPTDPSYNLIPPRFRDAACAVQDETHISVKSGREHKVFSYDHVFGPDTRQDDIWNTIADSVSSFTQGFNCTVLAYGQSGSGKSYTMGTALLDHDNLEQRRGVIPRAADALFTLLHQRYGDEKPSGLATPNRYSTAMANSPRKQLSIRSDAPWQLSATYMEIYNEQLRDLLCSSSVPASERPPVSIREDTKGKIIMSGLTQVPITSPTDLFAALETGSQLRQTDATAINAKSSRSHAIFTLTLVTKPVSTDSTPTANTKRFSMPLPRISSNDAISLGTQSKLHFVDLAGSERLKHTGANGERAKEGISINAGLASLGKVISQLSSRNAAAHVSYRDSRLTRLLQDSIGGTVITHMIACITPAEFYIDETLNTLHYAQRARAIQSKPEVQRVDDADKDTRIARLQAEVAILRQQAQQRSDRDDPKTGERHNRRLTEIQDQLQDLQDNYNALTTRHTRLIAELGTVRADDQSETPTLSAAVGESAVQRLQRSTSFAQAVEQVVTEYEKTIQGLEATLGNTRASLTSAASEIVERDLQISAMQSNLSQMQARIQKLTDQESNNETYMHRLEAEIEDASSSEEKGSMLVKSLRAELARLTESSDGSEAYIVSLEGRLAEAEQDHAMMQRELDRLEQVVERQRSAGRLDGLLADLGEIRKREKGHSREDHADAARPRRVSSPPSPVETHHVTQDWSRSQSRASSPVSPLLAEQTYDEPDPATVSTHPESKQASDEQDNATAFLVDRLEVLTQQLFDLRGEHDSMLSDHDELERKYQIALQNMARHDAAVAKSANPANGTLADPFLGGPEETVKSDMSSPQPSLSLASSSHTTPSRTRTPKDVAIPRLEIQVEQQSAIMPTDSVSRTSDDHVDDAHDKLKREHESALSQIETLKRELLKARIANAPSPTRKSPLLRRKPSQDTPITLNNNGADRTNRSFAHLRNISLDHFEHAPDVRQNFDSQLNSIMSDMHDRSERLSESQVELAAMRKDLENKTTMLAGLTRERSSLMVSSSMDYTVVGKMREQLEESERRVKVLSQSRETTENELKARIKSLESQLAADFDNDTPFEVPGRFIDTPALEQSDPIEDDAIRSEGKGQPDDSQSASGVSVADKNIEDHASGSTKDANSQTEGMQRKIAELEKALRAMTEKEKKSDRLVQELEDQLSSTYDQHQATSKRISAAQTERQLQLEEAQYAKQDLENEMENLRQRIGMLTSQHPDLLRHAAASPVQFEGMHGRDALSPDSRHSKSPSSSSHPAPVSPTPAPAALPSPPPAIPLPPIPGVASAVSSPIAAQGTPASRIGSPHPDEAHMIDHNLEQALEDRERRIRTVEKHLYAEKQLTATLEEALVDVETAQIKTRGEMDAWRKRCTNLEDELIGLRRDRSNSRTSLQAVEEEREMRLKAERARSALEERMRELNSSSKKKKKNALNCF